MGNQFNEIMQKLRAQRVRARRYTAMLLVLAMLTSLSVSWRLHQVGTALTTDDEYCCGMEEHVHTDDCYTEELVCGYEEGQPEDPDSAFSVDSEPTIEEPEAEPEEPEPEETEPEVHHHTADCYETVLVEHKELTCGQEEHTHDDTCPVDPDTGDFLCGFEEHTHTDDCFTTETETEEKLICGYEEGQVLSDGTAADDDGIAALEDTNTATSVAEDSSSEAVSEPVLHHHTEACYEKVLTCTIPEHTHTLECLADYSADVETDDDWEKYSVGLSDNWNEALLAVAKEQLGYKESEKNFQTDEALGDIIDVHHYTRYGAFYGNPYADWDVAFIAFCQHYAGIPKTEIPQRLGLEALRADMDAMGFAYLTEGEDAAYEAIPGDVVTYNKNGTADDETIGIVETVGDDSLTVISGAVEGAVAEVTVPFTDVTSTILVDQAYGDYVGEADDRDGSHDDEIAVQPADETDATAVDSGETKYPINLDDPTVATNLKAEFTLQKKDNNSIYQDVQKDDTVNEGDDLQVKVSIKVPAGTFSKKAPDGNKLTYTLPFKLQKPLEHQAITDRNDSSKVIGYLNADTEGNVTVEFSNEVDTFNHEKEFDADFKVWGKAVAKETGENQTIKFPGDNGSFTLKKKSDISVSKTADTGIIREGDKVYFKYTVTVSSQEGTAGENVTIKDEITQSGAIVGKYSNFELKKKDGSTVTIPDGSPKITKDANNANNETEFVIEKLDPLGKGERYVLTYYYELTNANQLTAANSVNNTASATYGNTTKTDVEWKTYTPKKISVEKTRVTADGNGNTERLQRIKWQITIKNPNNENLAGLKVVDKIQTSGSKMRMDEKIEIQDAYGNKFDSVNPRDVVNANKDGFTYTFPTDKAATSSSYTITYYTSIPDSTEGTETSVTNKVDIKKDDDTPIDTDSETTTVGQRDWYLVKAVDREMSLSSDGELLAKKWYFSVRTNASTETSKQFTVYDVLQTPTVEDKNGASKTFALDHYAKYDELKNSLESNNTKFDVVVEHSDGTTTAPPKVNLTEFQNATYNGTVTVTYYKDQNMTEVASSGDEVRAFKIDVSWTGTGFKVTQLNTASYNSYIKCTETGKTLDDLAGKDVVKAKNVCSVDASHKGENTASYTKPEPEKPKAMQLLKRVADNNPWNFGSDKTTLNADNPNGKLIWFKVLIKNPNADSIVIKDTLQKGLVYKDYSRSDMGSLTGTWEDSYNVGLSSSDGGGVNDFINDSQRTFAKTSVPDESVFNLSYDQSTNELTFTLKNLNTKNPDHKNISIIYAVWVEDDYWNDISADPSKKYTNKAEMTGVKPAEATATVTRTNFETKKEVAYNQTTQTATYTVTINEQSKQLLPYEGGYLELEDILTVPKGLSATLDQNSIVVKDGNDAVVTSDALKDCEIDPDTHTMKIKIKDGKKYKLSYTYKFVPDENLGSGASLTVQNEVKMFGRIASNNETHFQNAGGSGTASNGVTDILTLVKSEKGKNNNTLGGVTFALFAYENSSWTRLDDQTTATDGEAKGTITFRYNANNKSETGTVAVKADTLYQLVETQTAENYILDNTPHYFVMLSKNANADDVYQTFNGSDVPLQSNIKFVSAGQTTDVLKVENEARKIKVEKVWKDADGNAMAAPKDSITVTLKRKVGGAVDSTVDSTFNETLKLTQGNGWKVTYPDEGSLPETDGSGGTYYYFVTEDDVPDGYNVMYSYVDKDGGPQSEHGVTAGGTATITNQQKTDWLKVTKVWQDSDGNPLTENLPDKITLVLYEKGTPNVEKVRVEVKPDADGNWKYTFTGLNPDTQYYVVEDTVDGYTVSYTSDVEHPAKPGATITVINRKNAPGYELPATGSTGTAPYTTAGAVLMGAALVGGYRRKRRQERRGE